MMRSFGSRCEFRSEGVAGSNYTQFGNPWKILEGLMARYEVLDEPDLPFPLGGCFGYWGYDLKEFIETRLPRRAVNDLDLPDCQVGFYDSLVAFDHRLGKTWIISTGLGVDGSRSENARERTTGFWRAKLISGQSSLSGTLEKHFADVSRALTNAATLELVPRWNSSRASNAGSPLHPRRGHLPGESLAPARGPVRNVRLGILPATRRGFAGAVFGVFGLRRFSGGFVVTPELFLRLSGSHILTRPIKGTRPRAMDPGPATRN